MAITLKQDIINRFHVSPAEADRMIKKAAAHAAVRLAVTGATKHRAIAKDISYEDNPGAWREEVQKRMQAIEIMEDGVAAIDKLGKVLKRIIQAEEKMIASKTSKVNNKQDSWWDFQESGWAMGGREMFAQALSDILTSLDEGKLAASIVDHIGFKRSIPIPENDVAPFVPDDPQDEEEEALEPSPSAKQAGGSDPAEDIEASIIAGVRPRKVQPGKARITKAAATLDPKQEKSLRTKANAEITKLIKNKYFTGLPIKEVQEILSKYGFDASALDGIYTGRDGKDHEQVGPKTWISMSWHRMEESGRYEFIAYLS
jgi:hypothetical protein